MTEARLSRAPDALWRVWAAPGTSSRPLRVLSDLPCAPRRQAATDATSIGDGLPPRPRAARTRPEAGDFLAPAI
jgi:hypothetical protein